MADFNNNNANKIKWQVKIHKEEELTRKLTQVDTNSILIEDEILEKNHSEDEFARKLTQAEADSILINDDISVSRDRIDSRQNHNTNQILQNISSMKTYLDQISLKLALQTHKINAKNSDNIQDIEKRLHEKLQEVKSKANHQATCSLQCEIF